MSSVSLITDIDVPNHSYISKIKTKKCVMLTIFLTKHQCHKNILQGHEQSHLNFLNEVMSQDSE